MLYKSLTLQITTGTEHLEFVTFSYSEMAWCRSYPNGMIQGLQMLDYSVPDSSGLIHKNNF